MAVPLTAADLAAIDPDVLAVLAAFLRERRTGQFVLNVLDGNVTSCDVRTHFRTAKQNRRRLDDRERKGGA